MDKQEWRDTMKRTRDALGTDYRANASEAICRYIMDLKAWQDTDSVLLYLPFGSEINTETLIHTAWQEGKAVCLPICLPGRRLGLALYTPKTPLITTSFGLKEIPQEAQRFMPVDALGFCLIPGLIFDTFGGRIGYGGGYYDRFLPGLPETCFAIAAAFAPQIVPEALPLDPFDYRIPKLCSDEGEVALHPSAHKTNTE